jgi:hypothetical protein
MAFGVTGMPAANFRPAEERNNVPLLELESKLEVSDVDLTSTYDRRRLSSVDRPQRCWVWRPFLIAAVLFVSVYSRPQAYQFHDPNVFVRLSYDNSPVLEGVGLRHICIAVSRYQDFRIVRFVNPDKTTRLQGRLSDRQFKELTRLLADPDLRHVEASYATRIQKRAEIFGAEIVGADGTQRFNWVNADGEKPLPTSVTKITNWLTEFEPRDATPFLYSEHLDICPSGGVRLLPPSLSVR